MVILHTQIMSWVSGVYECRLCMVLSLKFSIIMATSKQTDKHTLMWNAVPLSVGVAQPINAAGKFCTEFDSALKLWSVAIQMI